MSSYEELKAVLQSAYGPNVVVEVAPLTGDIPELLPEERPLVEKVVEKRRREIAVGRHLARRALAEVGASSGPLLRNPDRTARWPGGYLGSISHTTDVCVVVAARRADMRWLSVDIESQRVSERLFDRIMTPDERVRLEDVPDPEVIATTHFSAKEAYYKAQYPKTETYLGFQDVESRFDDDGKYEAWIIKSDSPHRPLALTGFHRILGHWVVTGISEPT